MRSDTSYSLHGTQSVPNNSKKTKNKTKVNNSFTWFAANEKYSPIIAPNPACKDHLQKSPEETSKLSRERTESKTIPVPIEKNNEEGDYKYWWEEATTNNEKEHKLELLERSLSESRPKLLHEIRSRNNESPSQKYTETNDLIFTLDLYP